jgi:plastocyanin
MALPTPSVPARSRGRRRGRGPAALVASVACVGLLLVGCGSDKVDTADCTVVEPTAPGRTEVTVKAKAMAFDTSCLQVSPGTLQVTFVNEDENVPHNFNLKGKGSTSLQPGPDTQVLEVELPEPGTFNFVCDPHPQMKGAIVVA